MTTPYIRIYLLVTGQGERDFIHRFLGATLDGQPATFMKPEFIGQQSPRIEQLKELKVTGTIKKIPEKIEEKVSIPTLKWLQKDPNCLVVLIDDLERSRAPQAQAIFAYYRAALDKALATPERRARASVHFFVNMLEAYYFADPDAVNSVLGLHLTAPMTDVEEIEHPKNELKALVRSSRGASDPGASFDEREHGALIVTSVKLDTILDDPKTCRSLRTLVGWCRHRLGASFSARWRLSDGEFHPLTCGQIPWPASASVDSTAKHA